MSEVEKMYETVGIEPKMLCDCEFKNLYDYSIDYGQDVCIHVEDEIRHGCEGCELAEQNVKYYPPFTAEKQLELILFYINRGVKLEFEKNGNENLQKDILMNTIAGLANRLWQDLTEQERTEIAEILKG